ncbi:MAG: hypothetical protein ACK54X_14575 [Burkholderiales bacterium]
MQPQRRVQQHLVAHHALGRVRAEEQAVEVPHERGVVGDRRTRGRRERVRRFLIDDREPVVELAQTHAARQPLADAVEVRVQRLVVDEADAAAHLPGGLAAEPAVDLGVGDRRAGRQPEGGDERESGERVGAWTLRPDAGRIRPGRIRPRAAGSA